MNLITSKCELIDSEQITQKKKKNWCLKKSYEITEWNCLKSLKDSYEAIIILIEDLKNAWILIFILGYDNGGALKLDSVNINTVGSTHRTVSCDA